MSWFTCLKTTDMKSVLSIKCVFQVTLLVFLVCFYFNQCVVELHLRCTQKHVCVCFHVQFCPRPFPPVEVCRKSRFASLMGFTASSVQTWCLVIEGSCCIYLRVVCWTGLFGCCKTDCCAFFFFSTTAL